MNKTAVATLESLEAEWARLALAVEDGEATQAELERVEKLIAAMRRDDERREVAGRERVAREGREQARRQAEEHARFEEEHRRNDTLYRGACWELGEAVRAVRETIGVAALMGAVPMRAVDRGHALEPVRVAAVVLFDASTVALASAEKLHASRLPYARTNILVRGYFLTRLGRAATELLGGPVEPAERPGKDFVASLIDFFEGTR